MWQTDEWWVRLWDFPRLQIAGLLLVTILLLLLSIRRRGWSARATAVLAVAALAWQVAHFAAYLPGMPKQAEGMATCPSGRSLSLLNANVLQSNNDYDRLLALVARADPDVLLLIETGPEWARAVAPLNVAYPYRIAQALPNSYGMMLFSKLPLEGQVLHRLKPGVPSIAARLRLRDGEIIDFHGVHPEPPLPGEDVGERDAELVLIGRDVRDSGRAALVMGDLNDVAWSRTSRLFRRVAAVADPRAGRGFYPTYHADYIFARWPLDHLFVTPHFGLMGIDRLGDIGSDHFPILYRVCLAVDADRRLVPPAPGAETRQVAREEVLQGRQEQSGGQRGE